MEVEGGDKRQDGDIIHFHQAPRTFSCRIKFYMKSRTTRQRERSLTIGYQVTEKLRLDNLSNVIERVIHAFSKITIKFGCRNGNNYILASITIDVSPNFVLPSQVYCVKLSLK